MQEPLRVAVDATPLLGTVTGVGRFTGAVLDGLASRPDVSVSAYPFGLRGRRRLGDLVPSAVEVTTFPVPARLAMRWWRHASFPRLDRPLGRPHVVHGTNFVVPPVRAARVMTVHDLTTLRFPELCHPATLAFPDLVRRAAAEGAWVHTVSAAVAQEVVDLLGLDPSRVVSIPNGVDHPTGDAARGRRLAGHRRYVLAVGTVEPRKDLGTLVEAVESLDARLPELVVVHVGGDGWGVEAFERSRSAMRHPERFVRLGHVGPQDLADLYAGARSFVYPSVYEGFGLPVVEAMAAGLPVITTDVPALREVGGDAVAIVGIGDTGALAAAMARAWSDDEWHARAVALGLDRARAFSWRHCVDGLVGLYRRAVAESGPR